MRLELCENHYRLLNLEVKIPFCPSTKGAPLLSWFGSVILYAASVRLYGSVAILANCDNADDNKG